MDEVMELNESQLNESQLNEQELYDDCLSIVDMARRLRDHRSLDINTAVKVVIAARRENPQMFWGAGEEAE